MQVTDDARSSPTAPSTNLSSSKPCGVKFTGYNGRTIYTCALPKDHIGDHDDHPTRANTDLLEQQLGSLLSRADTEPDKAKRWRLLDEKVRAIYHALLESRINGNSIGPLVFGAGMILLAVIWAHTHQEKTHLYCAYSGCTPHTYVRVLEQFNDFDFRLELVADGVPGQPSVWHFCHDQEPLFEAGFLLEKFQFSDRGKCTEIAIFRPAYIIVRDTEGWPILPANCHQDPRDPMYGRVSCEGEPQF